MPVASSTQAEVIMEHKPSVRLPESPGEFLLYTGGRSITRGRSLLSDVTEVDEAIAMEFANATDPLILLWKAISVGKNIGDAVPGQERAYRDSKGEVWCTQPFVRQAYKHYVDEKLLVAPKKGAASRLAMSFLDGASKLSMNND
jgi:hypothetical protein